MIDEYKYAQYGVPRETQSILGITLHETGDINKTAMDWFDYYNSESKENNAFHYICDSTGIVQIMPDNYSVYHTGKTMDWGDRYTIAIAICSSLSDEKYDSAVDNAVELINTLKELYGITNSMIFFHKDFNSISYCPKTLITQYRTCRQFAYERL